MHEVVCNTSPLLYLHQLGLLALLPSLYGEVSVPQAVIDELAAGARIGISVPAPATLPWVRVVKVTQPMLLRLTVDLDPSVLNALRAQRRVTEKHAEQKLTLLRRLRRQYETCSLPKYSETSVEQSFNVMVPAVISNLAFRDSF